MGVTVAALAAACAAPAAAPLSANVVELSRSRADPATVTVPTGEPLSFVNMSGAVHVLVLGSASARHDQPGAPSFGGASGRRIGKEGTWTSAPWQHAGEYHVACTVHPGLNLVVDVQNPSDPSARREVTP